MDELVRRNEIAISIVIPVYNVEQFLRDSLDSIQEQTFPFYEVLLIDDGSTDASGEICDVYASADMRFRVFHRENQGPALSRNFGLEMARGKYIIFLDADDFFYPEMLSVAYQRIENDKSQVVVFGSEWVCMADENAKQFASKGNHSHSNTILLGVQNKRDFYVIEPVPWNKLIDLKWLLKNKIHFQDIPANNDVFFSMAIGLCAKRISVSDRILLRYYYGRNGSLTQKRKKTKIWFPKAYDEIVFAYWHTLSLSQKRELCDYMIESLEGIFIRSHYSSNCKYQTAQLLQECTNLLSGLREGNELGLLKVHAQAFLKKMENRELMNIKEFDLYLPTILRIFKEYNNQRIALWGCGKIGTLLLQGMESLDIHVNYIIDQNEQKQGEMLYGYKIYAFEDLKDKIDLIIVTGIDICKSIQKNAGEIKCIDIHRRVFGY